MPERPRFPTNPEGPSSEQQLGRQEKSERLKTELFSHENPDAAPNAKRVMLTFDNPGAYNGLTPVVAALTNDSRCKGVSVLASGWGVEEFRRDERFKDVFRTVRPGYDPAHPAHETLLADILEETKEHRPDIVLASVTVKDGPESAALFAGKSSYGAKKVYLFSDGWGSVPGFLKDQESLNKNSEIDGVFCCDEIAKSLVMKSMPGISEEKFKVTGSPAIDDLYIPRSEECVGSSREKLGLSGDTIAVLYAGDATGDGVTYEGADPEWFNIGTMQRAAEAMRHAAEANPNKKFAFLVRPHPRDTEKEALLRAALTLETPPNMQVKGAVRPEDLEKMPEEVREKMGPGLSMQEARYAADAVASITSTENFLMPRIGRPGIFLSFDEKGLANEIVQKLYGDFIDGIARAEPAVSFVHTPEELAQKITLLERAPEHVERPPSESSAAERILETILK